MPFDMNDLGALQRDDEAAWNRAWDVLWPIAKRSADLHMGAYFHEDVDDVASRAIIAFQKKGIHECNSPGGIIGFVKVIARNKAIDFVRKMANSIVRQYERRMEEDDFNKLMELVDETFIPSEVYGDETDRRLSDRLHNIACQLSLFEVGADVVADAIIAVLRLNELDSALLREHVIFGGGQREFAERYEISVNGVGGRKGRLLKRIRLFLESPPKFRRFCEEIDRLRRT
jgi:DNA-directed RNA polymerase specialized sigma24 family protein